jgi:hypothetical protein
LRPRRKAERLAEAVTMTDSELQAIRARLDQDDLIVVSRKFHEAAAEALRWMTAELKARKSE